MLAGVPRALDHPASTAPGVTRGRRLLASGRDALALIPPLAMAVVVAAGWLLARTSLGRDDASDRDTAIALAVVAAVPPAWLARLAFTLLTTHATEGQRTAGLRIEVRRARDRTALALRLAVHPLAVSGWAWGAGVLALAGVYAAALALAAVAALVCAAGLVSLAIVLVDPGARALHDRIAGTRVVRA
ncbi:MAG: RDD family protein [Dehalococcoidia bacterium]